MTTEGGNGVPKRLYKYRRFDERTLESLIHDMLHFTDPSKFNDPLDTRAHDPLCSTRGAVSATP